MGARSGLPADRPVFAGDPGFKELRATFPTSHNRLRAIIDVEVTRVSDSCGRGVPLMSFDAHRDRLISNWVDRDADAAEVYWAAKNPQSIDGLPAMPPAGAKARATDAQARAARAQITAES